MAIIFGTDGWRGLIGEDINSESVKVVAQAFADYINPRFTSPQIIIGYDNRNYSKEFAEDFASVLSGNNILAFVSDRIIPTPIVSYNVKANNYSAGVMITASHNPAQYNGIKFKSSYGAPFFTEETQKVEELLFKSPIRINRTKINKIDLLSSYKEKIYSLIDLKTLANANLTLLVDSMGGAGQKVLEELLSGICKVNTIFGESKPDFYGRYAEPIEKNLLPLINELKSNPTYAFGVANDGDADRIGVVLDTGEWLSAQETILIITDYLINTKKINGNIVKTSSVTDKLIKNFKTNEREVFDVQVGFKYIAEKMILDNIAFGCEESGGFGYGYHVPERDGIFSTLVLLEMLSVSGINKLSDYVKLKRKEFGNIFYDRIDYHYEKSDRIEILPKLFNSSLTNVAGYEVEKVDSFYSSRGIINGLKFVLKGNPRWLLLRASETEPLVRIYAEAENTDEVNKILEYGKTLING